MKPGHLVFLNCERKNLISAYGSSWFSDSLRYQANSWCFLCPTDKPQTSTKSSRGLSSLLNYPQEGQYAIIAVKPIDHQKTSSHFNIVDYWKKHLRFFSLLSSFHFSKAAQVEVCKSDWRCRYRRTTFVGPNVVASAQQAWWAFIIPQNQSW